MARKALPFCVLASILLVQQAHHASAKVYRGRSLAQESNQNCEPQLQPPELRCEYIKTHPEDCLPTSGLLDYLTIYYCSGLQYQHAAAALMTVMWVGFLFMLMFTSSDRFFCPAMELLSQYLRLSPAVAGATLLAFGNGAPDVFTQIAAAQSGSSSGEAVSPEALSMALSEPLGTGLFVGNVVLALTVAMGRGVSQHVLVKPAFFLKDSMFYLASLSMIFYCIWRGQVVFWQCLFLVAGWLVYIGLTIYMSRDENTVQLDPLQHEVPRLVPYGPWDDLDSVDIEDWDWLEVLPEEYREIPGHPNGHAVAHVGGVGYQLVQEEWAGRGGALGRDGRVRHGSGVDVDSWIEQSETDNSRPQSRSPPATGGLYYSDAAASRPQTRASMHHVGANHTADHRTLMMMASVSPPVGIAYNQPQQPSWLVDLRERTAMLRQRNIGNAITPNVGIPARQRRGLQHLDADLEAPLVAHSLDDQDVTRTVGARNITSSWPALGRHDQPSALASAHAASREKKRKKGGRRSGSNQDDISSAAGPGDEAGTSGATAQDAAPASFTTQLSPPLLKTKSRKISADATPGPSTGAAAPQHVVAAAGTDSGGAVGGDSPAQGSSPTSRKFKRGSSLLTAGLQNQNQAESSRHASAQASPQILSRRSSEDTQRQQQQQPSGAQLSMSPSASRSFMRIPSQRQAQGLVTLVKQVSSRYRYSQQGVEGGSGSAGGGSPEASHHPSGILSGGNMDPWPMLGAPSPPGAAAAGGGASHPGSTQPTPANPADASAFDAGLYVPLLLQGRLEELSAALDRSSYMSRGSGAEGVQGSSPTGGSPRAPMSSSGGALPTPPVVSPSRPLTPRESDLESNVLGIPPGTVKNLASGIDMAVEQKRLLKLLYYGHQQSKREREGGQESTSLAMQQGSKLSRSPSLPSLSTFPGASSVGNAPATASPGGSNAAVMDDSMMERTSSAGFVSDSFGSMAEMSIPSFQRRSAPHPGRSAAMAPSGTSFFQFQSSVTQQIPRHGSGSFDPNSLLSGANSFAFQQPLTATAAKHAQVSSSSSHVQASSLSRNASAGIAGVRPGQGQVSGPRGGSPAGGSPGATSLCPSSDDEDDGNPMITDLLQPLRKRWSNPGPDASAHGGSQAVGGQGSHMEGGDLTPDAIVDVDVELNRKIAAEVNQRVERHQRSRESLTWKLWRAFRRPLVLFLSFTMPMIERRMELHYSKMSAVALPLVGPAVWTWYAQCWSWSWSEGFKNAAWVTPEDVRLTLIICTCLSLATLLFWRSDGLLQGPILGIMTLLAFVGSMLWMNAAADELVGLLVAVGRILDLPSALLGATVLAWGNSLSDAVSNTTLARDGYPSMALTAIFASPLFILLAGVAFTLTGGTLSGPLTLPQDPATVVLYATICLNMLMWAVVIPFVFKFKLDWRVSVLGFTFYAAFQVAYVVFILTQDANVTAADQQPALA